MKIDCRTCELKSVPVSRLNEEQILKVYDRHLELSFNKGDLLTKQGTLVSHIIYLRKGFAKIFIENGGEFTTLGIATPGSFIGIQALYGEPVFPFSAEAMTDAEICMKDISLFRDMVLENSGFAQGVIEILNKDLIQAYGRMFSLTTKHIDARFSELLVFLSNVFYKSNPFELTISRKEIADLISTSPESISRLISNFKSQGIISISGHTVELLDMEKLQSMCDCDLLNTSRI